jgi:hypothetical protein
MPYMMDMCPEIMLMIEAGTKNGEMRRGPRSTNSPCVSSMRGSPPMPEPMLTPMRSAFASVTCRPQSFQAWIAAARP